MRTLSFLLLFSFSLSAHAVRFNVTTNKVVANLIFLRTLSGNPHASKTLSDSILASPFHTPDLQKLAGDFSTLDLYQTIRYPQLPIERHSFREVWDIIMIAAAQSAGIEDFDQRIQGLIPVEERQALIALLRQSSPVYDRMFGQRLFPKLEKAIQAYRQQKPKIEEAFAKLRSFYHSAYTPDQQFQVVLYPIPGERGHTTATPHGNVLVIGTLTGLENYDRNIGVAVHELCHILYDGQGAAVQHALNRRFEESPSPYARLAYSFFDEGMATACGNGWAYKQLNGKEEKGTWYANPYIDGFGHHLFPLVETYINNGKSIDSAFVDSAIALFKDAFPASIYDYSLSFNTLTLASEAKNQEERQRLRNMLGKYFTVYSFYAYTPVMDAATQEAIARANRTTLVVSFDRQAENLEHFMETFSIADTASHEVNHVYSFIDKQGRMIVYINAQSLEDVPRAFQFLEEQGALDPTRVLHYY